HRQPSQHHKCRKSATIKIESAYGKDQKQPDEADRNQKDDVKRLAEIFKQDRANEENPDDKQREQPILPLSLLDSPRPFLLLRFVADRHLRFHFLEDFFQVFVTKLGRAHVFKRHHADVLPVFFVKRIGGSFEI